MQLELQLEALAADFDLSFAGGDVLLRHNDSFQMLGGLGTSGPYLMGRGF